MNRKHRISSSSAVVRFRNIVRLTEYESYFNALLLFDLLLCENMFSFDHSLSFTIHAHCTWRWNWCSVHIIRFFSFPPIHNELEMSSLESQERKLFLLFFEYLHVWKEFHLGLYFGILRRWSSREFLHSLLVFPFVSFRIYSSPEINTKCILALFPSPSASASASTIYCIQFLPFNKLYLLSL